MAWIPRQTRTGIEYGGTYSSYYWNTQYNPNAVFQNCMANCTTYAYGRVLEEGCRPPVTSIVDASYWHNYLTSGWTAENYTTYSGIKPGDIIEWPGHVAVVERVTGGIVYVSSSLYTGDNGSAYLVPGDPSSGYSPRSHDVMGDTLQDVSDWMIANYDWRFFEYQTVTFISNTRLGVNPTYVLVNPDSGGGEPPTPGQTENLDITITPSSASGTMTSSQTYIDFSFEIGISGIPAGETVSGGNTFPGMYRVANTGWSYTDYVVNGVTYRSATKRQTLRYDREHSYAYSITKHMYFNITKTTGTISTDTPMYITVQKRLNLGAILGLIHKRNRKRGLIRVN